MKKILFILIGILSQVCFSNTTRIEDESIALEKVIQSIYKHKLTTLKKECLLFIPDDKGDYYEIEVREKHSEKCGGDPQISPRLFNYEVDKQTGKMRTDDPVWTGMIREID